MDLAGGEDPPVDQALQTADHDLIPGL